MGILMCSNCGSQTNTAVCNHLHPVRKDGKANECYLKWVDDKWEKGCGYDSERGGFHRQFADKLLSEQATEEVT